MSTKVECAGCGDAYFFFDETFEPVKCALCGSEKITCTPEEQ